MTPRVKYPLLFLVSLAVSPAFVLFHELRHYAVASYFRVSPRLHYAVVTCNVTNPLSRENVLISAAGPMGDAAIGAAGLLWLYWLRRHRRTATTTWLDWCATLFAMLVVRSLRCLTGTPSNPQPGDEALLSLALGWPGYLLPYLLGIVCLVPVVMMIRLHPPGARLLPFLSWCLGGLVGVQLWMRVVGPFLLP